ncbi:MAG: HAMP domain-containing sensor histidine kinase, partial [Pseudomonadota bacterium]
GDDTQLLLPPDDDFSGPIIEIEFWNRNGGILRKIAGDLTEAASFASDGNGANSPSPEDGLVRTRDGLAACRKTQVAVLDDQVGTVSCTVLSVSVFETVIEKRLHSLYQPEAKRLVLEIRRGDQSQVWAAREQDDAGGFIASKTMAAPFNTYQVIAFEENGKIDELLPFYGLSLFIIVGFVTTVGLATFVHREHVNALKIAEARVNRAAHLSHDLRTPLTNIRLYASMLDPSDNAEDFAKSRNTIVSEVEWLDGLIEHTLAVVRQGTGTSQLSHNADEIVEAACQRFRPLLQNRHSTITTDLDVKRRVRIDRWTLEQVLLNLLDNVRNHAPFSDVYVSTRLIDDRLTLVVQNETQNVSAHPTIELAGGPEQQRHYGMGLKICREIIESDGGEFLSEEQSGRFRAVAVFKVKDAVRRR